jgi:hypothetical protein
MVPSTGGLAMWVKSIKVHEPSEVEIKTLKDSVDQTITRPTVLGDKAKDEDPAHPLVEVTTHASYLRRLLPGPVFPV